MANGDISLALRLMGALTVCGVVSAGSADSDDRPLLSTAPSLLKPSAK